MSVYKDIYIPKILSKDGAEFFLLIYLVILNNLLTHNRQRSTHHALIVNSTKLEHYLYFCRKQTEKVLNFIKAKQNLNGRKYYLHGEKVLSVWKREIIK
jgi:hypothetical protein